jgi:hypothetical protein
MDQKTYIKRTIIAKVGLEIEDGSRACDVSVYIPTHLSDEIKNWCAQAFLASNYLDYARDDPCGQGVGRNCNGALCTGVSFDFDNQSCIKRTIIAAVGTSIEEGFEGVEVDVCIPAHLSDDIKNWCVQAFKASKYIDWARDDPCGQGVGRNCNGALCTGVSFDFF